ncbi:hypothetical protein [Streptomyces sp. NPDC002057]|uniref:hypothetical protein n=1 Tax=Streptomyces sp. NPDC002057 TaxID=3154664 RepID=UPI003321FFFC
MRSVRPRRPLLAAALALLAAGCGAGDAGEGSAPAGGGETVTASATATAAREEAASATPAADGTMSLERQYASLLTEKDLPGYRGYRDGSSESLAASALAPDKPVCKPIADAVVSVPSGATHVVRQVLVPLSGKGRTEVSVGAYRGADAQEWLTGLKSAVGPCATGFEAVQGTERFTYTGLRAEPLAAGDEAVAWSVTVTKGGVAVPLRLAVVRKKSNVALFVTDAGGRPVVRQPKEIIDAQVVKLP